jgi:peptidyl-prolyl cis-trans isomerase C
MLTEGMRRMAASGGWIVAAMMALMLGLAACKGDEMGRQSAPEPGDVAVARVNGEIIWASDVRLEAVAQGQISEGLPLDITSDMFRRTLEDVIDRKLMAQQARGKGLDRSVTAQRRLAAANERILADMVVENAVDGAIDEGKVRELYEEQVRLSKQSEEVRARMIVLKTRDDAANAVKQLQGGAMFEALAMERSIDQATRFNGGDMGYITTDLMPQAFKTALTAAQPGQLVGPVEIDGGWAVLRVEDRRPEVPLTLEESRPQIVRFLTFDQLRILLNDLRHGAKVDILIDQSRQDHREPAAAPAGAAPDSAPADASASSASSSSTASSNQASLTPSASRTTEPARAVASAQTQTGGTAGRFVAVSQPLSESTPGATRLIAVIPAGGGR